MKDQVLKTSRPPLWLPKRVRQTDLRHYRPRLLKLAVFLSALSLSLCMALADWELETVVSFGGTNGGEPRGALVWGSDGNLYGTTTEGGLELFGNGTIFKMTPEGILTSLWNFTGLSGIRASEMEQGRDDNFYGTAGSNVFRITPDGIFSTFCPVPDHNGNLLPSGALAPGDDGNFYGTTLVGGPSCNGTIFRMTPDGLFTHLFNFDMSTGWEPQGLIKGLNGKFYGVTSGHAGYETIFRSSGNLVGGILTSFSRNRAKSPHFEPNCNIFAFSAPRPHFCGRGERQQRVSSLQLALLPVATRNGLASPTKMPLFFTH